MFLCGIVCIYICVGGSTIDMYHFISQLFRHLQFQFAFIENFKQNCNYSCVCEKQNPGKLLSAYKHMSNATEKQARPWWWWSWWWWWWWLQSIKTELPRLNQRFRWVEFSGGWAQVKRMQSGVKWKSGESAGTLWHWVDDDFAAVSGIFPWSGRLKCDELK